MVLFTKSALHSALWLKMPYACVGGGQNNMLIPFSRSSILHIADRSTALVAGQFSVHADSGCFVKQTFFRLIHNNTPFQAAIIINYD
jgi:hypothetical protein